GNEAVIEWRTDEKGATVTTTRDTYHAGQIVFTSGAWTDKLLTDLGVKLNVTRQVMGWVQPRVREPFLLGRLPVWAIDSADGGIYYGFPLTSEQAGLKLAHHHPGEAADPDAILREPMPTDEQDFRPALEQYIPDANGPL